MSQNVCQIAAGPDRVYAVLTDGWLYAAWVVGASRVRAVDERWPQPGGRIHHSIGAWPALLHDTTEVEECRPPEYLMLRARARPSGEARVEFFLAETAAGTEVQMHEQATAGPVKLLPGGIVDPILHLRNAETLRRLRYLVERPSRVTDRSGPHGPDR